MRPLQWPLGGPRAVRSTRRKGRPGGIPQCNGPGGSAESGAGVGRVPRREKLAGQWAGQAWDRQLSYACSRRAGREEVQEEPGDTPPGARVDLTLTGKAGLGHPGARIPSSSFHSLSPDEEKNAPSQPTSLPLTQILSVPQTAASAGGRMRGGILLTCVPAACCWLCVTIQAGLEGENLVQNV